jgi:hypothetical protein
MRRGCLRERPAGRVAATRCRLGAGVACLTLAAAGCLGGDARVTVHLAERFQVMTGWEGLIGGQVSCNRYAWPLVKDTVLDLVANELGMNRVRLPLRSGYESHRDRFPAFMAGDVAHDDWKRDWFRPENDNDDPAVADPGGFQWAFLDHTVEEVVLPWRQRLVARGDDLWINLTYIGARNAVLHRDQPEEYAELVVETFRHLRDRYGLVPNSFEVVNEPNVGKWPAPNVARNLLAARRRLAEAGFHPDFVGPSLTTINGTLDFLDSMAVVPGAVEALDELAYHRYDGGIHALRRFGEIARAGRARTAMLEDLRAGVDELHEDLVVANVSAWQKFGMVACPHPDSGAVDGVYVVVDWKDVTHPVAHLGASTRYLRQYFRHVGLGAHRVAAVSSNGRQAPTAFVNRDGRVTVVIRSRAAGRLGVEGLPAGRYAVTATTRTLDAAPLADTTLADGDVLQVRMPAAGVLTVFAR